MLRNAREHRRRYAALVSHVASGIASGNPGRRSTFGPAWVARCCAVPWDMIGARSALLNRWWRLFPSVNCGFDARSDRNSCRVCDQVSPREYVAEDQPAKGGISDSVDGRRFVELEEFDADTTDQRVTRDTNGGVPGEDDSPSEEDHQRPEYVAGIFSERCGEYPGHASRHHPRHHDREHCQHVSDAVASRWFAQ